MADEQQYLASEDMQKLRDQLAAAERERDGWKREWKAALRKIAEFPSDVAESIADAVIQRLTDWKDRGPPTGNLHIVWPLDRQGIVPLIRWRFEAAVKVRTAELEEEIARLRMTGAIATPKTPANQ